MTAEWREVVESDKVIQVELDCVAMDFEEVLVGKNTGFTGGDGRVLPTFTKPILRSRPPPRPAGLGELTMAGKMRYQLDGFKFPPYSYGDGYTFEKDGTLFQAPSYVREFCHMLAP